MKRIISGAIFDMDGTLLDSMGLWRSLPREYLRRHGIDADDEYLERELRYMAVKKAVAYLKENYAIDTPYDEMREEIWRMMREEHYAKGVPLKPGVRELLEYLKSMGIPMAVASATRLDEVERALKGSGIREYFCAVVSGETLGMHKRDPEIFEHTLSLLGTPRHTTWVIEDSCLALTTARGAALRTVCIYDPTEPSAKECKRVSDIYLDTFLDFGKYF